MNKTRKLINVNKDTAATEAACSATSKAIAAAIIRGRRTHQGPAITRYASSNKAY